MACEYVVIAGRVQGVGFRYWVAREAEARGVTGWVCNLADGRVEAVFCGSREVLKGMLACVQTGPALAKVRRIERLELADGDFRRFEIRPTN